ncbi:MAG: amidohydrolase family protein, partial [Acidobacteria bacterium]|nr:amidohydrolase family protein [Acidobacteriota bacterium]
MKEHGTYWDPTTPALMDGATAHHDYDNVVTENRAPLMISLMRRNVRTAHAIGVKVVTGTDTPYGPNSISRIATEIVNFVDFGMPPLAALQAATIVSAEAYKLEKKTGAIEVGLEADLVGFDRNPLDDITVVHDPVLVISNGRVALHRKVVPERRTSSQ